MIHTLSLEHINGFSFKVKNSLIHTEIIEEPGVILPLKNSLRFFNGVRNKQVLQTKRDINAIAINGSFIAVGIKGFAGQLVVTYFFNIYQSEKVKKMSYQKTMVSKLAISVDGKYLCSLGQSDAVNQQFVIINTQQDFTIATKIFYRKTKKLKQKIVDMSFSKKNPLFFALMYINSFYFIRINQQIQTIQQILIQSNKIRQFNNFIFDQIDSFCYTVSKNGDIAQINVSTLKQCRKGPKKRIIITGIKLVKMIDIENLLIVGEKGFIAVVEIKDLNIIKEVTLNEEIVSISDFVEGLAYVSTEKASIFRLYADTLQAKPFYICLKDKVNQIAICQATLDSFITCSSSQIVIWSTKELKPRLKISLPKIQCHTVALDKAGKFIVSGWNDGSIRLFYTYNGKLMKKIQNCHPGPISKLIIDYNQTKIISGGQKGQIRAWNLNENKLGIVMGSMAHHMKRVNQLKINPESFEEMVCCCEDGTYSVWNLETYQLVYCFKVCNFVKDCFFQDAYTIQLVGSGSYIYKVMKANGKLIQKTPLENSHTNTLATYQDKIQNKIVIYGGQSQYLLMMNYTMASAERTQEHVKQKLYSQVTAIKLMPDKETILIGTLDGLLIKLETKQLLMEDNYTMGDQYFMEMKFLQNMQKINPSK